MIKLIIVGRRRAGATRSQALRHLRLNHAPMVYDPPADAGRMPSRYVQNHVFDGVHQGGAGGGSTPHGLDRDLVTQIWFDDVAAMIASTQTPYYLANLKPDEPRFVDDATVVRCVVAEGPREGAAGGVFKLFVFLRSAEGADLGAAASAWRDAFVPALEAAQAGWVENTATPRPGETPFADRVWEIWFADRAAVVALAEDRLPALLDGFGATLDRSKTVYLLAEEYTSERLRAERAA